MILPESLAVEKLRLRLRLRPFLISKQPAFPFNLLSAELTTRLILAGLSRVNEEFNLLADIARRLLLYRGMFVPGGLSEIEWHT